VFTLLPIYDILLKYIGFALQPLVRYSVGASYPTKITNLTIFLYVCQITNCYNDCNISW